MGKSFFVVITMLVLGLSLPAAAHIGRWNFNTSTNPVGFQISTPNQNRSGSAGAAGGAFGGTK